MRRRATRLASITCTVSTENPVHIEHVRCQLQNPAGQLWRHILAQPRRVEAPRTARDRVLVRSPTLSRAATTATRIGIHARANLASLLEQMEP